VSVIILLLPGFRRRRGGVNLSGGVAVQSALARPTDWARVRDAGCLGDAVVRRKKHIEALRRIYIPRARKSKNNFTGARRRELILRRVIKRVLPAQGFFSSHF
jgi:hypothetical protein